jgi:hypothetical protein
MSVLFLVGFLFFTVCASYAQTYDEWQQHQAQEQYNYEVKQLMYNYQVLQEQRQLILQQLNQYGEHPQVVQALNQNTEQLRATEYRLRQLGAL